MEDEGGGAETTSPEVEGSQGHKRKASPGDIAVRTKPGKGSPGVPRVCWSLKEHEIDRHVVDLYEATDHLKLTGQG